ncbi:MAG: cell division protein FtsZ [Nitrospinae bacterium]|nr:cell division protein FtsZ [Nitrospinota bacterium]
MSNLEFVESFSQEPKIKIIGVGGGGSNAVGTMFDKKLEGVDFLITNTDMQALNRSGVPTKLQLGANLTRGLGAGFNPEVGELAAVEDKEKIAEWINGADMVFITAGMGGGTGTGASPIIASVARENKILSIAVVTTPFMNEGDEKERIALKGIEELKKVVDSLIIIPNQKLVNFCDEELSIFDAFKKADEVLYLAVKGISDVINSYGYMNIDFNDVKRIMQERGMALMGIGRSNGKNRAIDAVEKAISSPLLDCDIKGAKGILINFTGNRNMTMEEINNAVELVKKEAAPDAYIKWGLVESTMQSEDDIEVTVIATGFESFNDRKIKQESVFMQSNSKAAHQNQVEEYEEEVKTPMLKVVNGSPIEINRSPFPTEGGRGVSKDVKNDASYMHDKFAAKFDYPTYLRKQNS